MQNLKYIIVVVVLIFGGVYLVNHYRSTPDENPGGNSEYVVPDDIQVHIDSKAHLIRLTSPEPGAEITNPVTVTGEARGYWYFEASFPISVVDWDGKIIGQGYATADGEWMTEEFVPFTGTVNFDITEIHNNYSDRGTLILMKDNPSGLPEYDDAL